jgi:hypothetical protein
MGLNKFGSRITWSQQLLCMPNMQFKRPFLLQYVHKLETLNPNVVSVTSLIKWKTVASDVGTAQIWIIQRIGAGRMEKTGKLCQQPIMTFKFLLMMRRLPWNS